MDYDISFWLIPTEKQEESIRKDIDILSEKYQSFPFIPHITIYHLDPGTNISEAISFVDESLKDLKKFEVLYDGMGYSYDFTKTLYAKYKVNEPLLKLHSQFVEKFKCDYPLAPHLSLIYKNKMGETEQAKEAERIILPPALLLDHLYVVTRQGGSIKEDKDVMGWITPYRTGFK